MEAHLSSCEVALATAAKPLRERITVKPVGWQVDNETLNVTSHEIRIVQTPKLCVRLRYSRSQVKTI
jgi:hypothetical protein